MTDAEFIKRQFEQDSRDKKRIAKGEKHRVKSKRGMKTPSEYLSKKERDKLNGEVKTYNLNKPMSWDEFKQLPDDLRVEYIKSLQQQFGAGDRELGGMFHIHFTAVQKERKRLGIASTNSIGRAKDIAAWEKWLAGDTKTMMQMELDKRFRTEPYVPEKKLSLKDTYDPILWERLPGPHAFDDLIAEEEPADKVSQLLELLKKLENSHAKITIELTL